MSGGSDPRQPQTTLPPLVVEIGLKEIYDLLVALNVNVAEMRAEVRDLTEQSRDHEERLRALERSRWPLPAVSVLVAIGALLMAMFPNIGRG